MQTENRFFDDLARLTGGAASVLTGAKTEFEAILRQQLEKFMSGLKLVTREEFEIVEAIAVKAREEQERLQSRVDSLEEKIKSLKE